MSFILFRLKIFTFKQVILIDFVWIINIYLFLIQKLFKNYYSQANYINKLEIKFQIKPLPELNNFIYYATI